MNTETEYQMAPSVLGWISETVEYTIDTWQRILLFTDTVRQQGTNFIEENDKGLPPVLEFEHQVIFDGRDLDRPVNYALARIMPEDEVDIPLDARPVVIIDPRAGHGPGIGGFKKESEVGIAMKNKHPVYFMIFSQYPVPDQTLGDVADAEIQFIEVIGRLHPKAEKPLVIGNCQAGWAAALLAADRPDITGPLFLNGSPLSYWAGQDVRNPMRYKGGLCGGTWVSSLFADLGNGNFDGANLVKGFEDLNPSNTLWKKNYNLYSTIDTEAERFLYFEKWWNGFFFLSSKEIKFITQDLFVGNKLETGDVIFKNGEKIDLKNLREPIVVFASDGDNITPPQQALNWVMKVWGSVENIKRSDQVIIYLLHKDIGHLGIFVSSKVVKKEHNQMIGNVDLVGYLSPGLYQMIIDEEKRDENGDAQVRFVARDFDNILEMDDETGEEEFRYVSILSELNDFLYQRFLAPSVKTFSNDFTAKMLQRIHPLRHVRYLLSDLNPALIIPKTFAPYIKKHRVTLPGDNRYKKIEKAASENIASILDHYRDMRDLFHYHTFYMIYGNPIMKILFGDKKAEIIAGADVRLDKKYQSNPKDAGRGGMAEGIIRCLVAMSSVKKMNDKIQLKFIKNMVDKSKNLVNIEKEEIKRIIDEQATVLKANFRLAISKIPELIKTPEDRLVAIEILKSSVAVEDRIGDEEKILLKRFIHILDDVKTLY